MFNSNPRIGQEILDVPMGEMVRNLAFAIAEGQMALDENSIEVAEMMGGLKTITEEINGEEVVTFSDSRVFFGKEKVSVSDAVTMYNTSTDESLKRQIYTATTYKTATSDQTHKETSSGSGVFVPATTGATHVVDVLGTNDSLYEFQSGDTTKIQLKSSASPAVTEVFVPLKLSLLELGFTPTFYQFVDTIVETKVSIAFTREGSSSVEVNSNSKTRSASIGFRRGRIRAKRNVTTTQVNAKYSQKFSYSAEGSSLIRTKLVPIPPPAILEERIQEQMAIAREEATRA